MPDTDTQPTLVRKTSAAEPRSAQAAADRKAQSGRNRPQKKTAGDPTEKTQNHENGDGGNSRPPNTRPHEPSDRDEPPTRTKHGRNASQRSPKRGTSAPTTRPGGRKTPPQPGRHNDRAQRRAARKRHNNDAAADRDEHHDTTGHHTPEKRTKNTTGTETPRTGRPHTANGADHETDDGSNEPTMTNTSTGNYFPNYSRKTAPCQAKTPRKQPTTAAARPAAEGSAAEETGSGHATG